MDHDDPQTLERMLRYLYTSDYLDEDAPSIADGSVAPHVAAEDVITDRYRPPHLRRKRSPSTEEKMDFETVLKESEALTPNGAKMMNNVLVYAIAERCDVPELKELAKSKFRIFANSKWPLEDFHDVADAIFTTTHEGDMGLRQLILDICARNFQEIMRDVQSRADYLDNSAIAEVVLNATTRKFDQDMTLLDRALAEKIALKETIEQAEEERDDAVEDKRVLVNRSSLFFDRTARISECRHCHESLEWFLEWTTVAGGDVQLRCGQCRTRHP